MTFSIPRLVNLTCCYIPSSSVFTPFPFQLDFIYHVTHLVCTALCERQKENIRLHTDDGKHHCIWSTVCLCSAIKCSCTQDISKLKGHDLIAFIPCITTECYHKCDNVQRTLIYSHVHHPLCLHFSPLGNLMLSQSGLLKFHMFNGKSAHCYTTGGFYMICISIGMLWVMKCSEII